MKDEASLTYAHIVQIGWSIGPASSESPATKALYVKPEGFEITPAATKYHHISQQLAEREGVSLTDALQQFMAEVVDAHGKGGRVVAHQIEFDYRVIYEELGRCGLTSLQQTWTEIAKAGYCTMHLLLGRWLVERSGEEVGPPTRQHTLSLDVMLRLLLPEKAATIAKKHDAGADAEMTRLIYIAAVKLARS